MSRKTIFLTILVWCLVISPASGLAFEWHASEGFQGWGFDNVRDIRFSTEGATIYSLTGGDFLISVSLETVRECFFVRAHFSTMSIDSVVTCALLSAGRVIATRDVALFSGRTWKECVFDFSSAPTKVPINRIVFVFRNCDSVQIRDLTATSPSFTEVWALQGYRAHNVNLLHPFMLYGYSLNLWLYMIIGVSGLGISIFYSIKRRKGALAIIAIIFFVCYLALDAREVLEEIDIMKTTYGDYLSAPPEAKRYHWDDYIVQFSDLIGETAPAGDRPLHFWGDDSRYLYMRYLLYPLRLIRHEGMLAKVNVFYASDDFLLDGNKLLEGEKPVFESGRGIPFAHRSFIYLTP